MAAPSAAGGPTGNDEDSRAKETAVAKTAGFVVFSGIAMSIIKALNPNKSHQLPPEESTSKPHETKVQEKSSQIIEISRGDTLWALSRKYGVSIDAIKAANGLSGDTIYAGKKLIIP